MRLAQHLDKSSEGERRFEIILSSFSTVVSQMGKRRLREENDLSQGDRALSKAELGLEEFLIAGPTTVLLLCKGSVTIFLLGAPGWLRQLSF